MKTDDQALYKCGNGEMRWVVSNSNWHFEKDMKDPYMARGMIFLDKYIHNRYTYTVLWIKWIIVIQQHHAALS